MRPLGLSPSASSFPTPVSQRSGIKIQVHQLPDIETRMDMSQQLHNIVQKTNCFNLGDSINNTLQQLVHIASKPQNEPKTKQAIETLFSPKKKRVDERTPLLDLFQLGKRITFDPLPTENDVKASKQPKTLTRLLHNASFLMGNLSAETYDSRIRPLYLRQPASDFRGKLDSPIKLKEQLGQVNDIKNIENPYQMEWVHSKYPIKGHPESDIPRTQKMDKAIIPFIRHVLNIPEEAITLTPSFPEPKKPILKSQHNTKPL
jgi:hypothetical protein